MKVSQLKKVIENLPDETEIMMYVSNKMVPVSTIETGTVENLEPTGETMFGMEVVGGKKKPVLIVASSETDKTRHTVITEIMSGVSALNMMEDGNDYSTDNVKKWVSHSKEHFGSAMNALM